MMARSLSSLCCSRGPSSKDSTCASIKTTAVQARKHCLHLLPPFPATHPPWQLPTATAIAYILHCAHLSRRLQHRPHDDDEAGCGQGGAHHTQAQLVKQVRAHSQPSQCQPTPELALPDLLLQELLRVVARRDTLDAHIDLHGCRDKSVAIRHW